MPIPEQTITIQDPGLGLTSPTTNIPLVMGASSSGTDDTVLSFTRIGDVGPALGEGPLVEYVTRLLKIGGSPVLAMKVAASIAGLNSAVVQSGTGPIGTLSGAPFDTYQGLVTIVLGGALGTATFTYSLDGGTTTSGVLTVPLSGIFPIPNTNVTITFAGTPDFDLISPPTYTWTSTEPQNNVADVQAGFLALGLLSVNYDFIVLSGTYGSATDANAMFGTLDEELTTLFNNFEYKRAIQDAGPDSTTATIAAFTTNSTRISACFGTATTPSAKPFVGRGSRASSVALVTAIEASRQLISTDLARVANGSLNGVTAISHDEFFNEVMDQNGFTTTRSWVGRTGFFLTNANLKSAAGSDFTLWQFGRIIDVASEVIQKAQQLFISRSVRTVGAGNVIDNRDAAAFETDVTTKLSVVLSTPANAEGTNGHVTAFEYLIDRTNDVLTSQTIISDTAIKPFGYVKFITTTIGFSAILLSDLEEAA